MRMNVDLTPLVPPSFELVDVDSEGGYLEIVLRPACGSGPTTRMPWRTISEILYSPA